MSMLIEKDSAVSLPNQVCALIVDRIRSGYYSPRKKLDSIRQLSDELQVSRGTVIEAFKLLEGDNYLQRIPAKGTFVVEDVLHGLNEVKVAFPFPESSILPASLGSIENWAIVSEVFRGMIEESRRQNAVISFMHMEDNASELQFTRQLRSMEHVDGAIFIGYQLTELQKALRKNGKTCIWISSPLESQSDAVVASDVQNAFLQLATLAAKKKYRRLKIIFGLPEKASELEHFHFQKKIQFLIDAFSKVEIDTSTAWNEQYTFTGKQPFQEFIRDKDFHFHGGSDIIYFANADGVPDFYRYCFANEIRLGRDVGAFGYASGTTYLNLIPSFTYSKINHFEIGRRACARCCQIIRGGNAPAQPELVPNTLVEGESV